RSTKTIVDMSTHLISFNKLKKDKHVTSFDKSEMKAFLYKVPQYANPREFLQIQNLYILGQIKQILLSNLTEDEKDILVLSRYNRPLFELSNIIKNNNDEATFSKIKFNSIHTMKGTQADHVFI